VRALVEAAVDAYLSANGENCPCLQGRPAGTTGARGSSCCLGLS
jgi:hypothetical protein